jgi:hypothetical protein
MIEGSSLVDSGRAGIDVRVEEPAWTEGEFMSRKDAASALRVRLNPPNRRRSSRDADRRLAIGTSLSAPC